jgi:hypothetical protein
MKKFPGGWHSLENSNPMPITDYILFASLSTGFAGNVQYSSDFISPTGGTWMASPISINAEPNVAAIAGTPFPSKAYIADMMNMQTKMWNNSNNIPSQLQNMIYAYGNSSGDPEYVMTIPLDLGGSTYDSFQISVFENVATQGDAHGNIQVIDFGPGPFTGIINLEVTFSERTGPLNIGIRLESSTNQSSIYELKTIILPTAGY